MKIRAGQDVLVKGYEVWRVFYFRNLTSLFLYNKEGEVRKCSIYSVLSIVRGPKLCETEDVENIDIFVPVSLELHREILKKNNNYPLGIQKFSRVKFKYLFQNCALEIKGTVIEVRDSIAIVIEWGCGVPHRYWEVPLSIIEEWVYFSD